MVTLETEIVSGRGAGNSVSPALPSKSNLSGLFPLVLARGFSFELTRECARGEDDAGATLPSSPSLLKLAGAGFFWMAGFTVRSVPTIEIERHGGIIGRIARYCPVKIETYCKVLIIIWRRGWDLNPRYPLRYVRFRGGSFQPLTHLSGRQLPVASCQWPVGALNSTHELAATNDGFKKRLQQFRAAAC